MLVLFFLYDLLYTSFSLFKTEYIYEKQYRQQCFLPSAGCFPDDMQSSSNEPTDERKKLAFGAVTCNNPAKLGRFRFHRDRFMNLTY